jgi:hypothetical protein
LIEVLSSGLWPSDMEPRRGAEPRQTSLRPWSSVRVPPNEVLMGLVCNISWGSEFIQIGKRL